MEPNKLESVHTIVCDAIAHHFPDWKDRSRVSYEIAFMLKKYMTQNDCTIGIANNEPLFFKNTNTIFEDYQKSDDSKGLVETIRKLI